jgi:hypothetical protein
VSADWTILAWMLGAAFALWLLQRQLHRHIQGLVLLLTGNENLVAAVHFLLLLPGIVLHELSHWLAAKLLGVRVGAISIGPERKRGKQMRFGSVQIGRADAVRESLIGLAPLISGTALVLILARWGFGLLSATTIRVAEWPAMVYACLQARDAWLWVYLIFAVANAMLPSASDRRAWRTFGLYLGLVIVLALALGGIPTGNESWLAWGLHSLTYLAYAYTLTAIVDLAALTGVLALEWLVGRLTGRCIEYGG